MNTEYSTTTGAAIKSRVLTLADTILQIGVYPGGWAITRTGLRTPGGRDIPAQQMDIDLEFAGAPEPLMRIARPWHWQPAAILPSTQTIGDITVKGR